MKFLKKNWKHTLLSSSVPLISLYISNDWAGNEVYLMRILTLSLLFELYWFDS